MNNEKANLTRDSERRKNNRKAITAVIAALAFLLTFLLGYFVNFLTQNPVVQKTADIYSIIQGTSIYAEDNDADEIAKKFVYTVVGGEDKYAKYYSPAEYKRITAEDSGNYSGVGIAFFKDDSEIIAKVYPNSSAYKAGVCAGDKLVAGVFRGENAFTLFTDALAQENEGKPDGEKKTLSDIVTAFFAGFSLGEEVNIRIDRGGEQMEFSLTKCEYVVSYVEYFDNEKAYYFSTEPDGFRGREKDGGKTELSEDTSYIKLHEFHGGAAKQFAEAINYMYSRGKSRLILDLRDNGGGLLNIMTEIASYLINDNGNSTIKIMSAEGKNGKVPFYTSSNNYDVRLTDVAVIANLNTASASECLIGALADYGNPTIYGGAAFGLSRLVLTEKDANDVYRTYGKGIMQTTYLLKSGGALALTTAKIFWPISDNVCVQGEGIKTDVAENGVTDGAAIVRANTVLHTAA